MAGEETTLRLRRTFQAPRQKVFRAWTEPEELKKWWGPDGFSTPSAEIDLRVGGRFRIAMKSPRDNVHVLVGTYREVRPPERLVYTWRWEAEPEYGETLVTVEFLDRGESTEVVLTHELFPTQEACRGHEQGWKGSFDRLAKACNAL
jgi:uncharacterized protein YndB with AHSA1/START domain